MRCYCFFFYSLVMLFAITRFKEIFSPKGRTIAIHYREFLGINASSDML